MKHPPANIERDSGNPVSAVICYGFRVLSVFQSRFIGFIWALLVFLLSTDSGEAQASREYQLKAVFLYNFAQFSEWPKDAFESANSPLVIGILGNDPFGRTLDETVNGETVNSRHILIEHYRRAEDIKACHILFINQTEARQMDEIVNSLKGKPILTVCDSDNAAFAHSIICFAVENNKVHFRINQEAAKAANITLSSKLLRVADAAPPGRPR